MRCCSQSFPSPENGVQATSSCFFPVMAISHSSYLHFSERRQTAEFNGKATWVPLQVLWARDKNEILLSNVLTYNNEVPLKQSLTWVQLLLLFIISLYLCITYLLGFLIILGILLIILGISISFFMFQVLINFFFWRIIEAICLVDSYSCLKEKGSCLSCLWERSCLKEKVLVLWNKTLGIARTC